MPLIHHNGYIAIVFYIIWSEGEFSSFTTFFIQWNNSNWKWTFNGFTFFTSISRLMEWNEVTIIQIQTCNDTCFRIESFMLWLFNIETMHSKKKEGIERTKGRHLLLKTLNVLKENQLHGNVLKMTFQPLRVQRGSLESHAKDKERILHSRSVHIQYSPLKNNWKLIKELKSIEKY